MDIKIILSLVISDDILYRFSANRTWLKQLFSKIYCTFDTNNGMATIIESGIFECFCTNETVILGLEINRQLDFIIVLNEILFLTI